MFADSDGNTPLSRGREATGYIAIFSCQKCKLSVGNLKDIQDPFNPYSDCEFSQNNCTEVQWL